MNIYEQQARNRRMTWGIMFVFVVFFLVIGMGFDFFYLRFSPLKAPAYKWNSLGYYEASVASQPVPYGTIFALLIGLGMVANSMVNGAKMVLSSQFIEDEQAKHSVIAYILTLNPDYQATSAAADAERLFQAAQK